MSQTRVATAKTLYFSYLPGHGNWSRFGATIERTRGLSRTRRLRVLTLVTGASGLVGNNIVRLLVERGEQIRVLSRGASDGRPYGQLDVQQVRCDIRDAEAVRRACDGVDRVIHAAAHVHIGWSGFQQHQTVNVEGARNVAAAALAAGVRLVHVSSVDTLGIGTRREPAHEESPPKGHVDCPYVVTKRAAEQALLELQQDGLDVVIVNPCYMLGPWDWKPSSGRMLLEIARGLGLFAPPGGNDFCDARDVAAGILLAAELGQTGRRYILTGEAFSYFEAWSLFAEVTGARQPQGVAWPWVQRAAGKFGDAWGRLCGKEPDINSAAVAIAGLPHHFCGARAQSELGFQHRPLRESAEDAWRWFREYGYA